MNSVAPFLIFYIGAVLVAATQGRLRAGVLLALPIIGALNLFNMDDEAESVVQLFDYTLTIARTDSLSMLFGYLFHLAAFIGIVFSLHLKDSMQHVSGVIYAGSALGAVFAGDLITLFVFWEMMAASSVFLILARRTEKSLETAMRYLGIQVASGLLLLIGVLIRAHETGSIAFEYIGLDGPGAWLIFIAFGVKCAWPFLHNWLTDAYPQTTPTGAVFMSAFTTKVAVYALARGFPGTELLVYIGAAMTMFPIFYAVIENDLRRVLSYSMINQVGFMVVGIGIGTELALNGAVSHAFNDVIFKGLLFMSMGAVLHMTGKIKGTELGGLYKSMPWTTGFCIVGAASISAFPLFSGFVSKSMVMAAALEEGYDVVWLALLFASAGVFHHAGIKIPFFTFFSYDSGIRTKEPPWNMLIAMGLAAAISVFNGSYPWVLYSLLPFPVDYAPYTAAHVLTQSQLLFFSALAFCMLKLTGLYPPEIPGINIDAEWSYRRLLPRTVRASLNFFRPLDKMVRIYGVGLFGAAVKGVKNLVEPAGALGRTATTGSMATWVLALLGAYLAVYLF